MQTDLMYSIQQSGAVIDDAQRAESISGVPASAPAAVHFGDPVAEYTAAGNAAVLFDLADRTQLEITGGDRAAFLHNFCTNDINKLQPGQGCEAFITNVKGRVLGHVFVFAGPDSLWLDTVPGQEETLRAHLERYVITEDVTLTVQTSDWPCLFISGPAAQERLQSCGIPAGELSLGDHRLVEESFGVGRVDWLGQPGFELGLHKSQVAAIWQRLVDGGIRPAGAAAFHTRRIAAAFPWYGSDVSEENLPQESGRSAQAVSFTKGCYLGQEPIARLDAMGHVNKELCVLRIDAGPLPAAGSAIRVAGDDADIGKVTSAARCAADAPAVALGYLRSAHTKPGTEVVVDAAGNQLPACVIEPE